MYKVLTSKEIQGRYSFGKLCGARKVHIAVEVGTDLGLFASDLLTHPDWDGELVCIDPYEEYEWKNVTDRTPDLLMAAIRLAPFSRRVRIVRDSSPAAFYNMPDWIRNNIGFVYIDGKHDFDSVLTDIRTWWNVPNPAAIIGGHDYDKTHPEVIEAVNTFAQQVDATVYVVKGEVIRSWYIYKDPNTKLLTDL